ncbi:MAG: asparaginase [Acidobacteria bacterium]|nr:asparaginase [Acidobacteriota bacterium]
MTSPSSESAVEITRGEIVECAHAAAIAVAHPDGRLEATLGDPERIIFLRSAAKPFQAAAVLEAGIAERYGLLPPEIALISSSHAGEPHHVDAARSILARAGLPEEALQCGTHLPFSRPAAERVLTNGGVPGVLMNNCSGKHAGMLAASRALGHPLESYLDPEHPVQRRNLEAVAAFTGRSARDIVVAVDGCSAPTFGVSLREAAVSFARLVAPPAAPAGSAALGLMAGRVASAMRAHPEMVAGDGMLDTVLMRAIPRLLAKIGADGFHAMGWDSPSGPLGIAVKIFDGDSGRARTAVVLETLRQLGALSGAAVPESLRSALTVRNLRGREVGSVRATFRLSRRG